MLCPPPTSIRDGIRTKPSGRPGEAKCRRLESGRTDRARIALVEAERLAQPAGVRALVHHKRWVLIALPRLLPLLAFRDLRVLILAKVAKVRADRGVVPGDGVVISCLGLRADPARARARLPHDGEEVRR